MSPLGAEVRENALLGETKNYHSLFRSTETKNKTNKPKCFTATNRFSSAVISDFHYIPIIKKNPKEHIFPVHSHPTCLAALFDVCDSQANKMVALHVSARALTDACNTYSFW